MSDWREVEQRRLNAKRQEIDLSSLHDEIRRLNKEIEHALIKLVASETKSGRPTKECFYCAEFISKIAKVCPICRHIFVEHAFEVFKMEKMTKEFLTDEKM
mgnify:CR=1 FL=1|tara:strand:+ start:3141 stop:3443 length:303 start_codon:yes stop_codon:yes gene_type:complete